MKKLAIVGSHADTRGNAPYDDPDFDIWVFNEAAQADWCKRWTACFQMHRPEVYQNTNNVNNRNHWDWLQQDHRGKVIWMQDYDDFVPCCRPYPLREIIETLPAAAPLDNGKEFLTSTAAMSIPLMLYLGYEYCEVYGVDLDSNTEYASQQNGWMYWAGVAKAVLGRNFVVKSGEHLFQAKTYGYEGEVQLDRAFFEKRADLWASERQPFETRMYKLKERLLNAITDFKPDDFSRLIVEAQDCALTLGETIGAGSEAKRYAERAEPSSAQEFERTGAQAQEDCNRSQSLTDKESGKMEYVWNAWRLTSSPEAAKQLRAFAISLLVLSQETGRLAGVMKENKLYMGEYNERARAAGGVRTLRAMGMM